jgi:hypothetical protein
MQEPYGVYDPMTGEAVVTSSPRPAASVDMATQRRDKRREMALQAIQILGTYAIHCPRRYAVLAYFMANPCESRQKAADALGISRQAVMHQVSRIKAEFPNMAAIMGLESPQAKAQQRRRNGNQD